MTTTTSTAASSDQTGLHVVLGSGPAGGSVVDELVARGHRVRSADRSGKGPRLDGVEYVTADLSDADAATAAATGAAVLYHCVNVAYPSGTAPCSPGSEPAA